jgi:rhodanese-related sulfurtransferase
MRTINHREVLVLREAGATIVETLPPHEYRATHIGGARNLPLKSLWRQTPELLPLGHPVVVYCRDSL